MASATESSVESLQLLLAERDTTIATIKERTKTFVEKLKSDHGEALVLEQTSRQQLQVRHSVVLCSCRSHDGNSFCTKSLRRFFS